MSEQIISVLDAICEKLGVAIDWTQENILPYAQTLCEKYIRYEIVTSIVWCLLFLTLTIISLIAAKGFHKQAMALSCPYDEDYCISWVAWTAWSLTGIFAIITIIVTCVQVFDIVTCVTFPEKILIEFASSIMKN